MFDESKNVFERISNQYYELTEAERKAADYVTSHRREAQLMSISELAESCGVAEATVTRFCRRLSYKGYTAFKLALAHADALAAPPAPVPDDASRDAPIPALAHRLWLADTEALAQTLSLLKPEAVSRAAELLSGAEKVLCMGQGGSSILAMEAAHLFSTALPGFQYVMDSHMQSIAIAHLTGRDVVLFVSYSGSTREVTELLPMVKERGAAVILLTRFPKSPAAAHADVILQCGANELPLQHGSVPARMSQLFLVDLLFAEVCRRKPQSDRAKNLVADALSRKHL